MENPDDYEIDDEGPEVTEEEYQKSNVHHQLLPTTTITTIRITISTT